jgi:protein-S-isoprenylcysteine O-methyltransferase Ste14
VEATIIPGQQSFSVSRPLDRLRVLLGHRRTELPTHRAVASSQFHALLGVALLIVAYLRKTRLEDQILARKFGAEYDSYRRDTWALVPLFF